MNGASSCLGPVFDTFRFEKGTSADCLFQKRTDGAPQHPQLANQILVHADTIRDLMSPHLRAIILERTDSWPRPPGRGKFRPPTT